MSGYRVHSFDPGAYDRPGPPLRPFNWVQWTGVVCVVVALLIDFAYFAGVLGWTRKLLNSPVASTGPLVAGISLINSRRYSVTDPAPELAAARRRWLTIIVSICAVVLGAATVLAFQGD